MLWTLKDSNLVMCTPTRAPTDKMARMEGIEPPKGSFGDCCTTNIPHPYKMVGMDGYAPSHTDSQSVMLLLHHNPHKSAEGFASRFVCAVTYGGVSYPSRYCNRNGWLGRDRTYDMRINSALLLPLSY